MFSIIRHLQYISKYFKKATKEDQIWRLTANLFFWETMSTSRGRVQQDWMWLSARRSCGFESLSARRSFGCPHDGNLLFYGRSIDHPEYYIFFGPSNYPKPPQNTPNHSKTPQTAHKNTPNHQNQITPKQIWYFAGTHTALEMFAHAKNI